MANRKISDERKLLFYIGMGIAVAGFLSFISVFITGIMNFGDFNNFENQMKSSMIRAVLGILMIIVGSIMSGIGRVGLAGSGIKLDPEAAREDVEPWSRMQGGVIKDVLDEAGIQLGGESSGEQQELTFDDKLRRLEKLRQDGLINFEEFNEAKRKILEDLG